MICSMPDIGTIGIAKGIGITKGKEAHIMEDIDNTNGIAAVAPLASRPSGTRGTIAAPEPRGVPTPIMDVATAPATRTETATETSGRLFPAGKVIWWDELTGSPDKDTPDDPPEARERNKGKRRVCVYSGGNGYEDDDDFLTWRTDPDWIEPECSAEVEYYITARSRRDPLDPKIDTYYYCERHFADNIGCLCENLAATTVEDERAALAATGELPNRMSIIAWGSISDLDKADSAAADGGDGKDDD